MARVQRLRPEPRPLEGVGRQADDLASAGAGELPVHPDAELPQPRAGLQQLGTGVPALARRPARGQGAEHGRARTARHVLPHQAAEGLPRAQLDEHVHLPGHAVPHAVGEAHRADQLVGPVRGARRLLGSQRLAGEVRHDGGLRRVARHRVQQGGELLARRAEQGRVEGVRGAQRAAGDAVTGQQGAHRVDLRGDAAEHRHRRAVERRDVHLGATGREHGADPVLARGDRDHLARGGGADQVGPLHHHMQRVLQREDPGQAGGDVLAQAVADQHVRRDSPVREELRQRVLDREHQRMRDHGVAQRVVGPLLPGAVPAEQRREVARRRALGRDVQVREEHRPQVHARPLPGQLDAPVDRLGVDRLPVVQLPAEAQVLVADAGQQERDPGVSLRAVPAALGGRAPEQPDGVPEVRADQGAPVVVLGAAGPQRVRDVGQGGLGQLGQPGREAFRLLAQG